MKLNEIIKKLKGFISLPSNSCKDIIEEYQNKLCTTFSKEYLEYLKEFGIATFGSHEFTGIINSKRLCVVDATERLRNINKSITNDYYVVEELNIDNIYILQNKEGIVFEATTSTNPKQIATSLAEYLQNTI